MPSLRGRILFLEDVGEEAFYDLIYIVTHVVYTHNDYGVKKINPLDLLEEFFFLRENFHVPYGDEDCETYAEFVDTMKSFGLTPEALRCNFVDPGKPQDEWHADRQNDFKCVSDPGSKTCEVYQYVRRLQDQPRQNEIERGDAKNIPAVHFF